MTTVGAAIAKDSGLRLSDVVRNANAGRKVWMMKGSGALTREGKKLYQAELKKEGVKSIEALIEIGWQRVIEELKKTNSVPQEIDSSKLREMLRMGISNLRKLIKK